MASVEVAPAPGLTDRASSLAAQDGPTIAADLKYIRESLSEAQLPTADAINETNSGAIREFFAWLRTAKEREMPPIDYTILPKGRIGHYEMGLLGKGAIKVSKHIHEYDAYLATSLYWQMVKKEGDSSSLSRLLDRIPVDSDQVRELVDRTVGGKK